MKADNASIGKQPSFLAQLWDSASGRSAFSERVFDYLEQGPLLQAGERLMTMNLERVHVNTYAFWTDIEISFTLESLRAGSRHNVSKSARELAAEPPPEVTTIRIGFDEQVVGEQVFHFTFTSRRDFEINLVELQTTVEALYQDREERRAVNEVFFNQLNNFMHPAGNQQSPETPLRLPPARKEDRAEKERNRLRRRLREMLLYHHYKFRSLRRADRVLGLLMVIPPAVVGTLVIINNGAGASWRAYIAVASLSLALIAAARALLDLPARAEEHRYFSNRYRELLRVFYQETGRQVSDPKQLERALALITLQAQELSAQSPPGFRRMK